MPVRCPNCGTENRDVARFCMQCRAPLVSGIVCARCGTTNPPYARFCQQCAAPLSGASPGASPAIHVPPMYISPAPTPAPAPARTRGRGRDRWIMVGGALLGAIVMGTCLIVIAGAVLLSGLPAATPVARAATNTPGAPRPPTGMPASPTSTATPPPTATATPAPPTATPIPTATPVPTRTPLPLRRPTITAELVPGQSPIAGGQVAVKVCWSNIDDRAEAVYVSGGDLDAQKNRRNSPSNCVNDVYVSGLKLGQNTFEFRVEVRAGTQSVAATTRLEITAAPKTCPPNPALVEIKNHLDGGLTLYLSGPDRVTIWVPAKGMKRVCLIPGTYAYTAKIVGYNDHTGSKSFTTESICWCWDWYPKDQEPADTSCDCSENPQDYSPP